jgi:hypothetical protein
MINSTGSLTRLLAIDGSLEFVASSGLRLCEAHHQFRSGDKCFLRRGNLFIGVQEHKEQIASSPL